MADLIGGGEAAYLPAVFLHSFDNITCLEADRFQCGPDDVVLGGEARETANDSGDKTKI